MIPKKQHRKFLMVNNNVLYRIYFHSHYEKISTNKIKMNTNNIKDINDFYNIAIILYNDNNLKIIDDEIINVDTTAINEYKLKNIFISHDNPDLNILSTIYDTNDIFDAIKYTINIIYDPANYDPLNKNSKSLCTATIDDNIEKIKLNDNIYNYTNKDAATPIINIVSNGIQYMMQLEQLDNVLFISDQRLQKNGINIKNIYKIWSISHNLILYDNEIFEEEEDDYYTKFSKDFDLDYDDYDIGDNSLGNEEYDNEDFLQFIQFDDGTILMCFNLGITIIELYDRPNFTILLVDKMNIYEYNINKGLKLLMRNMNINWFGSCKLNKIIFNKIMFFTYNDNIKKICVDLLMCTKFTQFEKITKYIIIDIIKYIFNDIFL